MPTTDEMIGAATEKVSHQEMIAVVDVFVAAAFGGGAILEAGNGNSTSSVNDGLVAASAFMQKKGWSDARTAAVGIRIYRAYVTLRSLGPAVCLFIERRPHGVIKIDDELIGIVAKTPMRYDPEEGVMKFDAEYLISEFRVCVKQKKNTALAVDSSLSNE